jgi:hypothetical protein
MRSGNHWTLVWSRVLVDPCACVHLIGVALPCAIPETEPWRGDITIWVDEPCTLLSLIEQSCCCTVLYCTVLRSPHLFSPPPAAHGAVYVEWSKYAQVDSRSVGGGGVCVCVQHDE